MAEGSTSIGLLQRTSLNNLEYLDLEPGQICVVVGPNGSGKSALLKHVAAGLDEPGSQSCAIMLEGSPSALTPGQTVEASLGRCADGTPQASSVQGRIEQAVHELLLSHWRHSLTEDLPRSIARKVELGCLFIAEPGVLLLDEPTEYLDGSSARSVEAWLRQLARQNGATILVATRYPSVAQAIGDRVILIREQQVILDERAARLAGLINGNLYLLRLGTTLDAARSTWFGGMIVAADPRETQILALVADQAALHGLLNRVHDLSIPLLSVERIEPKPETILMYLIHTPLDELHIVAREDF